MNTFEIQTGQSFQKGLGRYETYMCRDPSKVINPPAERGRLDRYAHPHIGGPAQTSGDPRETLSSLRQNLVRVVGSAMHNIKDRFDERLRNVGMKEIRHAVDENRARTMPTQRDIEGVGSKRQRERIGERFWESASDPFRITPVAAW